MLALRTGVLARWVGLLGFPTALALMVNPVPRIGVALIFPAWVMVPSIMMLIRRREVLATPSVDAATA